MRGLQLIAVFLLTVCLGGCATLLPTFETPKVAVSSFRMIPGKTIVPTFEIGLHVSNPNAVALNLVGLTYQVELEGHQVISGVANDLPVIKGYASDDIILQGQPDLLGTFNLFQDLMRCPREQVLYRVDVALDVGRLLPKIRINREGQVSFK